MILLSSILSCVSKIFLVISEFSFLLATFLEKSGADCSVRVEVLVSFLVFLVRGHRLRVVLCGLYSLVQAVRQQTPWLVAHRP